MADHLNDISSQSENALKSGAQQVAHTAASGAKKGVRLAKKGIKAAKTAGKTIKAIASAIKSAVTALISILGPVGLVIIAFILIFGLLFVWFSEDRGTGGDVTLGYEEANPFVFDEETGAMTALSMTEPQAIVQAYYKYIACQSYTKDYKGSKFTFREDTEDFAGLTDYYDAEGDYYLAPEFIMMADEILHDGAFRYPEQIIKPVKHELVTDPSTSDITAEAKLLIDDAGNIDAKSIRDCGFGSVLEYQPWQKDVYTIATVTSFQVDFDIRTRHYDPETKRTWYTYSHQEVMTVNIRNDDTEMTVRNRINQKIAAYKSGLTTEQTLLVCGNANNIPSWLSTEISRFFGNAAYSRTENGVTTKYYLNHMPQAVEGKDREVDLTTFNDSALNAFKNDANGLYPVNVALLDSAATFSGNVKYTYHTETTTEDFQDGSSSIMADPVKEYEYSLHCAVSNRTGKATKTGQLIHETPVLESKTPDPYASIDEEADNPWGYDYFDTYVANYKTEVPKAVTEDTDFVKRVQDEETITLLKELGLLREQLSGGLTAATGDYTASDIEFLAKVIKAEAGSNKLDELMVGAVFMNRVYSPAYPDSMDGVLKQSGQYACYSNGSWASATPSESNRDSARRVLSGEFAIPSNVLFQSANVLGNVFIINQNSLTGHAWESTHYYCYSGVLSNTDRFGRTAPTAEQVRSFASGPAVGGEVDEGEGAVANTYSGYKLYADEPFQVLTATSMLHKIAEPDKGFLDSIFSGIINSISSFFDTMNNIFPDHSITDETDMVPYSIDLSPIDQRRIIYQAITFRDKVVYTQVEQEWSQKAHCFLFIGDLPKNSMLSLISSVGSVFSGWVSPTEDPYTSLSSTAGPSGKGVQLSTPEGTTLLALYDGSVIGKTADSVTIQYDNFGGVVYTATYHGMKSVDVSVGTKVEAGDTVGTTGLYNDSPSFVFEFYNNNLGIYEDPLVFFYQAVYASGTDVVSVALAEYTNYRVRQLSSETKKYQDWCYTQLGWGIVSEKYDWCAFFVSWCGGQCYPNSSWPLSGSCNTIEGDAKSKGVYHERAGYTPQPGDIIFYDWPNRAGAPNHVGIVIGIEDGYVITVEGNTGRPSGEPSNYTGSGKEPTGVWRKKHLLSDSQIMGYASYLPIVSP